MGSIVVKAADDYKLALHRGILQHNYYIALSTMNIISSCVYRSLLLNCCVSGETRLTNGCIQATELSHKLLYTVRHHAEKLNPP